MEKAVKVEFPDSRDDWGARQIKNAEDIGGG
jgi:hypothetical protein